jgi:hypothetical protein
VLTTAAVAYCIKTDANFSNAASRLQLVERYENRCRSGATHDENSAIVVAILNEGRCGNLGALQRDSMFANLAISLRELMMQFH